MFIKESFPRVSVNVCAKFAAFTIVSITGVSSSSATTMASPVELTSYSNSIEDSRITSEQVQVELPQNPQDGVAYQ